ncbi:MAG: phage scaffolding protein [Oscillibacter sp.]|nr:phage scaffolding protein [Oscillibacter sp.]
MKKLLEILKANGIDIPEDKQEAVKKALGENYKSMADYNKAVTRAEQERDGYKGQLDTLQESMKGLEGKAPADLLKEVADWKKKAQDAKTEYEGKITARDQRDWLNAKLDAYGVKSPFARRQLMAECMDEKSGLKWKGGETGFFGFDDFMKAAKAQDAGLYQTAEEKEASDKAATEAAKTAEAAKNAPKFTGPAGEPSAAGSSGGNTSGGMRLF